MRDGLSGVLVPAEISNFDFLHSTLGPALGRKQFHVQWLRGVLHPGRNRPGFEVYRTLPFGVFRMSGAVHPLSIHLHDVGKDNL